MPQTHYFKGKSSQHKVLSIITQKSIKLLPVSLDMLSDQYHTPPLHTVETITITVLLLLYFLVIILITCPFMESTFNYTDTFQGCFRAKGNLGNASYISQIPRGQYDTIIAQLSESFSEIYWKDHDCS